MFCPVCFLDVGVKSRVFEGEPGLAVSRDPLGVVYMLSKKKLHETAFAGTVRAHHKQCVPFIDNDLLLNTICAGENKFSHPAQYIPQENVQANISEHTNR